MSLLAADGLRTFAVALVAASAMARAADLAPRAPPPDISTLVTWQQIKALDQALKPHMEQAQKTFPGARARFVAGLDKRQSLFVTTRIYDECGRSELVFISVARIEEGIVHGKIWTRPVVTNYRLRDSYAFPENQLVDWVIVHADGTEEGNVVGRLMKVPN